MATAVLDFWLLQKLSKVEHCTFGDSSTLDNWLMSLMSKNKLFSFLVKVQATLLKFCFKSNHLWKTQYLTLKPGMFVIAKKLRNCFKKSQKCLELSLMPLSVISKLSLVSQTFSQNWFYVWFPNRHLVLLSMRSGFPEVKYR